MRPSIVHANEQLDPQQQLANTPPPQSVTQGLYSVSIHQMAPPQRTSDCSLLLIYRPPKDNSQSWPSWLTWFTHITDHSSDTGRAQDRESLPAKDRQLRISVRLKKVDLLTPIKRHFFILRTSVYSCLILYAKDFSNSLCVCEYSGWESWIISTRWWLSLAA